MDDDVRVRLRALEMATYVLFTALADESPAAGREALDRLRKWREGQQDDVRAALAPALQCWAGYLESGAGRPGAK